MKYEYYVPSQSSYGSNMTPYKMCQTFTPTIAHSIGKVKLKLIKYADTSAVAVTITATDVDGKPTGEALATGAVTLSELNVDTLTWTSIILATPYALTASIKYAIVVEATGGNIGWNLDVSQGTYVGGQSGTSPGGDVWGMASGDDYAFEEWSIVVYPTDAQTRVTSLIHRYDRGTYTLEVGLGEVIADFGLPEWESKPRRAYPEVTFQERMEATAKQLEEEADMSREESLRIARKLETLEDIERRERGVEPRKAVPTREEFWAIYPGVPYPYGEQGTTTPSLPSIAPKPAVTPEEEQELIKLLGIQLYNKLRGQQ